MKVIQNKLRKSAIIPIENFEEDVAKYYAGCIITLLVDSRGGEQLDIVHTILKLWKLRCAENFFKDNPSVDDVLLFSFKGEQRILEWVFSKETIHNEYLNRSVEPHQCLKDWLEKQIPKEATS